MSYTAVIVNFNGREVLGPTLKALQHSSLPPEEIIIVDNQSADGSVAYIKEHFPKVTVIETGGNIGFGRGNNLGIAEATTPYVLLVNNDLQVDPDCAAELLKVLEDNPAVGIASPLIFRGWDRSLKNIYSYGSQIDRAGFTINCKEPPEHRESANCFTGACCLARTELLQKNPFEPHYFLYYEEPELTIRLAKQGVKLVRVPSAMAWHLENYSSPKKAAAALAFRQFYGIQNRWYALGKHWPARLLPKAFGLNVLHLLYFLFFFAEHGEWRYFSLIYRAPFNFLQGVTQRRSVSGANKFWWKMLYPASIQNMLQVKQRVIDKE